MRLRHIEVFNAVMLTGSVSGAARLINVTHSEDHHESFITVWYWEGEQVNKGIPAAGAPPASAR